MKEIDKKLLFEVVACKKAGTRNLNQPSAATRTVNEPCIDKASVKNKTQINSANKSIADINEDALPRESESTECAKRDFKRKTRE